MKKIIALVAAAAVVLLTGCATIIGHNTQTVGLKSVPPGAHVVITDETGNVTFQGTTPTTVTLKKSNGHYFGGKDYMVKLTLPGYRETDIALKTSPNGWYIGGNILFGGLIGWLIVDPFNGGMYTLSPEQVDATLTATTADNFNYAHGNLSIVMIQNVPQSLRNKMKRIGTLQVR